MLLYTGLAKEIRYFVCDGIGDLSKLASFQEKKLGYKI
jgi:hypothetical protein